MGSSLDRVGWLLIFDHPLIGSGDMAGAVDDGAMGLLDGLDLNEMIGVALKGVK